MKAAGSGVAVPRMGERRPSSESLGSFGGEDEFERRAAWDDVDGGEDEDEASKVHGGGRIVRQVPRRDGGLHMSLVLENDQEPCGAAKSSRRRSHQAGLQMRDVRRRYYC